jgi:hypothetical protein
MDTLLVHEEQYKFFVISRSLLLGMRNVSDKSWKENQNADFVINNFLSQIVPFMR